MAVVKVDLKEISREKNIPYSDVLWDYVAQDFLWRVNTGGLEEFLWLKKPHYETGERLSFYYVEGAGRGSKGTDLPEMTKVLQNIMVDDVQTNDRSDIIWSMISDNVPAHAEADGSAGIRADEVGRWSFMAKCDDIDVPFSIKIEWISEENAGIPVGKDIEALNRFHKDIHINVYSPESILGEQIFEIMEKLELVSDMKPFASAYEILIDNSISGRHIVDIFKQKAQERPKVVTMRRLEQIKGYRGYAYMKKRWNQYVKRTGIDVGWEDALDLILGFLEPVWTAFCNNEIFFDDWMPELGRFLG